MTLYYIKTNMPDIKNLLSYNLEKAGLILSVSLRLIPYLPANARQLSSTVCMISSAKITASFFMIP